MSEKGDHIRVAKVCLRESRARTNTHRDFSFTLLQWAANQRRKAFEALQGSKIGITDDMFGGANG